MKLVEPKVALIASTKMETGYGIAEYFNDLGIPDYNYTPTNCDATNLILFEGKLCYKAFEPGLNPNVTKVRKDADVYLDNIFKSAHGSILEHINFTLVFWYVSRVFTHELVRHRVGSAFSQESLRYVRLDKLNFYLPKAIKARREGEIYMDGVVRYLESAQSTLSSLYGIDSIKEFSIKKQLTSAFRRVAPIGLSTSIVWTTNLRNLRHVIQMRTDQSAEEEIRLSFSKVMDLVLAHSPNLMKDFLYRVEQGEWFSKYCSNPYDQRKLSESQQQVEMLQKRVAELEKDSQ